MNAVRTISFLIVACVCLASVGAAQGASPRKSDDEVDEAALAQKRWDALDPELKKVLQMVDRANEKVKDIRAAILYVRSIPLLEEEEESKGSLVFKKPDRVILKLGNPRNEEARSDGKHWWLVRHGDKQVEIYDVTESSEVSQEAAFLKFGYGRPARELLKDYDIRLVKRVKVTKTVPSEQGSEKKQKEFTEYCLRFIPRKSEAPARYASVEITVCDDTWLPHRIVLHESDGEIVHRLQLEALKLNGGIKDEVFHYEPPKDYTVLKPTQF